MLRHCAHSPVPYGCENCFASPEEVTADYYYSIALAEYRRTTGDTTAVSDLTPNALDTIRRMAQVMQRASNRD